MRIRTVKPEFWKDPDSTGRWPVDLKLFYIGMWCIADDQARFPWEPELIAAELFPYDRSADVARLLERLAETGRVVRYELDGRAYGFLPKFLEHQRINRPTRSKLPPPPKGLRDRSLNPHGGLPAGSRDQGNEGARDPGSEGAKPCAEASPPAPLSEPSRDENGIGNGTEEPVAASEAKKITASPAGRREPPATPLGAFLAVTWPDIRDPDGFTHVQAEANPGVDLLAEARKAKAWEVANPERRKRKHGPFLSRWFARAQDDASRPGRNGAPLASARRERLEPTDDPDIHRLVPEVP